MYNFNEKIAYRTTKLFGSMWAFWLFAIWAFLPLIPALSQYKETILYISSGFVQLVALPLIMVGQEILGRSSEKRAETDHQVLNEQFEKIKELIEELKDLHQDTHKLLAYSKNITPDRDLNNGKNF
jgi:Tfp pilus assembly protein PilN